MCSASAGRRRVSLVAFTFALGCRSGLPAEPPGHDATEATAPVPPWQPALDVTRTSAFAGEKLDGGGHGHHHHGHAAGPAPGPAATEAPEPPAKEQH